jgi:cysteine-rich repeat protein
MHLCGVFFKGKAAFVANLDTGCSDDDKTGLLFLQSSAIDLPLGALVPRVSFDHWFAIERGWDGGNLKLSVNEEPFTLIPTTAIEFNTYEIKLNSPADDNTNPLASQPAYTGASDGLQGAWEQARVNLYGLAQPGDSFRFRFDFGIDRCNGVVGWYVGEVRVYSCSDELPPSDCGNGVLDTGEQCDDGNNYIGDGCSNTCQVEASWMCTNPLPPGEVLDRGFEAGTPNPYWVEASTTFGAPICDETTCGLGIGSGPASGDYWAWFGGVETREESSLRQSVTIPSTAFKLTFELEVSSCDSGSDYLEVSVDDIQKYLIDGSSPLCGSTGYSTQTIDISAFADRGVHSLEFHAETFGANQDVTNFFVDDIAFPGTPSICRQVIFFDGFESN